MTTLSLPQLDTDRAPDTALPDRSTLREFDDIARAIALRKITVATEEVPDRAGRPILRASATAVIRNPWLGTGTTEDLAAKSNFAAPLLAKLLSDRLIEALGGADAVEAFGKAAFVGTAGELEHASALIHTAYFGNLVREALEGTSILCFVDGRAGTGELIRVPLWHKSAAATRSHYQTLEVHLADAPRADEIAVIAVASTGPRPHARIGDRTTDTPITTDILKEIAL
ncbi:amino acid synthesis family protein [Leucobacter japonicus]|uniref:amino acid synthesis family protein n=1 Tax=Leucobacter japonicus TaxID=1461259 RepID=UPI0009E1AFA7|nr:amino acid synthesis family protein [Leucobacter japonicus]